MSSVPWISHFFMRPSLKTVQMAQHMLLRTACELEVLTISWICVLLFGRKKENDKKTCLVGKSEACRFPIARELWKILRANWPDANEPSLIKAPRWRRLERWPVQLIPPFTYWYLLFLILAELERSAVSSKQICGRHKERDTRLSQRLQYTGFPKFWGRRGVVSEK